MQICPSCRTYSGLIGGATSVALCGRCKRRHNIGIHAIESPFARLRRCIGRAMLDAGAGLHRWLTRRARP